MRVKISAAEKALKGTTDSTCPLEKTIINILQNHRKQD